MVHAWQKAKEKPSTPSEANVRLFLDPLASVECADVLRCRVCALWRKLLQDPTHSILAYIQPKKLVLVFEAQTQVHNFQLDLHFHQRCSEYLLFVFHSACTRHVFTKDEHPSKNQCAHGTVRSDASSGIRDPRTAKMLSES